MEFGTFDKKSDEQKKREEELKLKSWNRNVFGPIKELTDYYSPKKNPDPQETKNPNDKPGGEPKT